MADNGMDVGTPEDWVHESYKLQTWMNVYSYKINPVNGRDMWNKFECPTTLLPPKVNPQIGRPPKKSKDETVIVKGDKLTRKGKPVTCSNCQGIGHNKRGCKATGLSDGGQRYDMPSETLQTEHVASEHVGSQALPDQPLGSQRVGSQVVPSQPLVNEHVGSQAEPSEPVARKSVARKPVTRKRAATKPVTRKRVASEIVQVAQGSQNATQGSQAATEASKAPTSPTIKRTKMNACRLTPDK
ncbi:hypothetical protein Tco_0345830 [Tanacetum coccineum]